MKSYKLANTYNNNLAALSRTLKESWWWLLNEGCYLIHTYTVKLEFLLLMIMHMVISWLPEKDVEQRHHAGRERNCNLLDYNPD